MWLFDLNERKYRELHLKEDLVNRFGHVGIIEKDVLFVFGGTTGLTHERNDLLALNLQQLDSKVFWSDSQEERARAREEKEREKEERMMPLKKSRRDSGVKMMTFAEHR